MNEELVKLCKELTDALCETTEKFNYGIYDELIDKAIKTLLNNNSAGGYKK